MSRRATGATTITQPFNTRAANVIPEDICPVCKRNRYLNTSMTFKINPECYHPMCSQCVETIFKSGPAQCPYASCNKTLRLKGFREAMFADLTIQREVDIRKRVAAVFNNTQDDFETLRHYNNYLQDVEDLTFSLVYGDDSDRMEAEVKLIDYEQQHKAAIERNKKKGSEADALRIKRQKEAEAAAVARKAEQQHQEEEARAEEAKLNQEVMEALQRGEPGSAADIQARIMAKKKAKLATMNGGHFAASLDASRGISIRGLRQKKTGPSADEEDRNKPYSPYAGIHLEPTRYSLQSDYENPHLVKAKTDKGHQVGGYSTQEYITRAMFEAFAGLGVMVGHEKASDQRNGGTTAPRDAAARSKTSRPLTTDPRAEINDVFV
ncbi:CDK-activating kinase assembly factor MAT1-domain-containing protein [Truncatella angustata]|uniref:RNA polymerase II transcription factor B subunit 3 n=1 Tax=Truncatella angustata TaxID=152316 RepID=A0A9P8UQR2_9PEZI|nr:CDK-activating kinase assembly factor MAT1-domain-containing protein [Truncatella angustata]KAH6657250.1 CDK-activating kinase assembly factor MAT1-domain-containing protein [Truncatella angustata]